MLSVGANSELEITGLVLAKYIMVEPNNIFSNIGGEVEGGGWRACTSLALSASLPAAEHHMLRC